MLCIRPVICVLLVVLISSVSVVGNDLPSEKVEFVRTRMTTFGAVLGLGPFVNPSRKGRLYPTCSLSIIPTTAVATARRAIAGRWGAEVTLALELSVLLPPFLVQPGVLAWGRSKAQSSLRGSLTGLWFCRLPPSA